MVAKRSTFLPMVYDSFTLVNTIEDFKDLLVVELHLVDF